LFNKRNTVVCVYDVAVIAGGIDFVERRLDYRFEFLGEFGTGRTSQVLRSCVVVASQYAPRILYGHRLDCVDKNGLGFPRRVFGSTVQRKDKLVDFPTQTDLSESVFDLLDIRRKGNFDFRITEIAIRL